LINGMIDTYFLVKDGVKQNWELELERVRLIAEGKLVHDGVGLSDLLSSIQQIETATEQVAKCNKKIANL
jgi:hypothetical protein